MSTGKVKLVIREIFRSIGLDVSTYRRERTEYNRALEVIKCINAEVVIDVGGNLGQFGTGLFDNGFEGSVVSFEPLPEVHAILATVSQRYPNWVVEAACALGDKEEATYIKRSGNSASSSLLSIRKEHIDAAPGTATISEEKIIVRRLDSVKNEEISRAKSILLKLDVQGYELKVLAGCTGMLDKVNGIMIEASLVQLYDGAPLLEDIVMSLSKNGFRVVDLIVGLRSPRGQVLQVDLFAVRNAYCLS